MRNSDLNSKAGDLKNLPVADIKPNPANPRLIFRGDELMDLAASIQEVGVQVPINVYADKKGYTIIDGERRWRACKSINLERIPAIIYPKPTPLQNLVFMFNIHRFRVDWDPLPAAMKLDELREIWTGKEGVEPTEAQMAALTGMTRGTVRRCRIIMEIPGGYREMILKELEKPDRERVLTTDLFVEAQRSVRTIRSYLPNLAEYEEPLLEALIDKYQNKVIVNVTHMRYVAKIARAASKGVPEKRVSTLLKRLVDDPQFGPEQAYDEIAWVYDARTIQTKLGSLIDYLDTFSERSVPLEDNAARMLRQLRDRIQKLLGEG